MLRMKEVLQSIIVRVVVQLQGKQLVLAQFQKLITCDLK